MHLERENFINDRSHPYVYNYRSEELPKVPTSHTTNTLLSTNGLTNKKLSTATLTIMKQDGILDGRFKRTQEMPVSYLLKDSTEWNTRVETHSLATRTERAIKGECNRMLARENSIKKMKALNKYISSIEGVMQLQEEVRRQKREGTFSTERRLDAASESPIDRGSLKNRFAIEHPRLQTQSDHSGIWELSKTDARPMWSDTSSFRLDSPGDIVKVKNIDRSNYGVLAMTPSMSDRMIQRERSFRSSAGSISGGSMRKSIST
jgi:hypothetical protein